MGAGHFPNCRCGSASSASRLRAAEPRRGDGTTRSSMEHAPSRCRAGNFAMTKTKMRQFQCVHLVNVFINSNAHQIRACGSGAVHSWRHGSGIRIHFSTPVLGVSLPWWARFFAREITHVLCGEVHGKALRQSSQAQVAEYLQQNVRPEQRRVACMYFLES